VISGKVAAVADERWAVRVLAAYAASPGGPAHLVLAVIRVSAPTGAGNKTGPGADPARPVGRAAG